MNWKTKKEILIFKKYGGELFWILIGALIMALGTSLLLLPNQLSSGGFAGIATITYYLAHWPMGITILILNIPLFLFTIYKLGKESLFKTILGSIAYSIFIDLFAKWTPLTEDRFLACIYGGILIGVGTAILLRRNATTGGTELVSNIVKAYCPTIRTSSLIVGIDIVIVLSNMILLKEFEIGLYSAIAIYIMGKMIDIIFEGSNFTKLLFIISEKNEEIAKRVGENLKRGTTGLYGKGMYTNSNKLVILCAAGGRDYIKVKDIALEVDPKAFIVITNAREVFGKGFK